MQKLLVALSIVLPICVLAGESGMQTQARDPNDESLVGKWLSDKPPAAPVEQAFETPLLSSLKQWTAFQADYGSRMTIFELALDSLSVGNEDRIVRFAVAITPKDSKVRNIRFEGIDCSSKQYRVYAYGSPDGSWQQTAQVWKIIVKNTRNMYEGALYDEFCSLEGPAPVKDIVSHFGSHAVERVNTGSTK